MLLKLAFVQSAEESATKMLAYQPSHKARTKLSHSTIDGTGSAMHGTDDAANLLPKRKSYIIMLDSVHYSHGQFQMNKSSSYVQKKVCRDRIAVVSQVPL
jgi:hypothetical protein